MKVCEEHGLDYVVVYASGSCLICATLNALQDDITELEGQVSDLEGQVEDLMDELPDDKEEEEK